MTEIEVPGVRHGLRRRAAMGLVIGVLLSSVATVSTLATESGEAREHEGDREVERPKFSFLRQNEDWSSLAAVPRDELRGYDRIKYVPLNASGSVRATFGGSARGRLEIWDEFAFGVPANRDDDFTLWRVTGHGDFRFGARTRLYLEAKSALSSDRDLPGGERTLDVDVFDLHQGFVDVAVVRRPGTDLTFRIGRRALLFGKQRIVSPLPWGNTLRAWDGASAILRHGAWTTEAFWTRPVTVLKRDSNRSDDAREFYGAYATRKGARTLDLYALGLDQDDEAFNGTRGEERRYTVGGRLETPLGPSGLRGEIEAAYQFGRLDGNDVGAWMATLDLRWNAPDLAASPTFGLVVDLASGDRTPGGAVQTFHQLFPLGHAYLGMLDFVGRQNIVAVSLPMKFRLADRWSLTFAPHRFRRFEATDAMYNPGGGILFAADAGTSREIGTEFDVVVAHDVNRHLRVDAGYGRFVAGTFVEQAGGREDTSFAYLQANYHF